MQVPRTGSTVCASREGWKGGRTPKSTSAFPVLINVMWWIHFKPTGVEEANLQQSSDLPSWSCFRKRDLVSAEGGDRSAAAALLPGDSVSSLVLAPVLAGSVFPRPEHISSGTGRLCCEDDAKAATWSCCPEPFQKTTSSGVFQVSLAFRVKKARLLKSGTCWHWTQQFA